MIDVEKGWLDGGEASWKDEKTPLGPPPLEVSRGWCKVVFVEAAARELAMADVVALVESVVVKVRL